MSTGGDDGTLADRRDRLGGDEEDPALAGVAVAVGSTVVTMVVAVLVAEAPLARFGDGTGATLSVPMGNQVGWAFLAAHGVPIHVVAERWMLTGTLVQSPVVYAVPPVTLFVGGYLLARMDDRTGLGDGFRAGSLTAIGYVLIMGLVLLGTRHEVHSTYADVRVWGDLLRGVWAGAAYALGFAGGGGALGGLVRERLGTGRHLVEVLGFALVVGGLLVAVVWAAPWSG